MNKIRILTKNNKIAKVSMLVCLLGLLVLTCPSTDCYAGKWDNFGKDLLPGDFVFSKGLMGRIFMEHGMDMMNGHVGIYIGTLNDVKVLLPPKERSRLLRKLLDKMVATDISMSARMVVDVFPDEDKDGANVFLNDLNIGLYDGQSDEILEARRYIYPLTDPQRGQILGFLIDHLDGTFDWDFVTSPDDAVWSCWEFCEAAYREAGLSIMGVSGVDYPDILNLKNTVLKIVNMLAKQEISQFYGFMLLGFATFPLEKTMEDEESRSCFAIRLTGGDFFRPEGGNKDYVVLIRSDLGPINYLAKNKGYYVDRKGPFKTFDQAQQYIQAQWDPQFALPR